MKKLLALTLVNTFLSINIFGQTQNNSPSSDCFADIPHRVNIINDSVIPVSVYIHESECLGCFNYLAFTDIYIKGASQSNFGPVLSYNSLSYSDFINMFSEFSENDPAGETQSFIDALPERSNSHTIIFTADTNWWIPPVPNVTIDSRYFYFTINIPKASWLSLINEEAIDFKVVFGIDLDTDEEFYFRVFTTDQDFPSLPGSYYGDVHYHSVYTQDLAENGMPLSQTKRASKYLGLDWTVLTDHSCDFDNYGNSMEDNWNKLGNEVYDFNQEDSSFIFIRGMEASVLNESSYLVHALAYPDPLHPYTLPFICDGNGDLSPTGITVSMLLDSLEKYNGFCYASHPFSEGDALPSLLNGGIWNLNDSLYTANGDTATGANIIWNDLSIPSDIYSLEPDKIFRNRLSGGELLNLNNYLTCKDTYIDPWNTCNSSSYDGFTLVDPTDILAVRFNQNMSTYSAILKRSIIRKNNDPSLTNWMFFYSGGTDAHGSFNYSTTEYVWSGLSGRMTESAIGTAFTIAYCDNGMGQHGENVLNALKNGHTAISTGPVMNFKIITPDGTFIPGDLADLSLYNTSDIYVTADISSNDDFGQPAFVSFILINSDTLILETETTYSLSGNHIQIRLDSLFMNLNCNGLFNNSYLSLQASIHSQKYYSPQEELIRKTNSREFFCITNPVFIKTGIIVKINAAKGQTKSFVYPNPADAFVNISSSSIMYDPYIMITDIAGTSYKYNLKGSGSSFAINTQDIPEGHYIITITDLHTVSHAKVLILHN